MSKQMFADAFDDALRQRFATARETFLRSIGDRYFSDETHGSLAAKLDLVRARMAEGRSFSDACDDPDVYLGRLDREYISHCCSPGLHTANPHLDMFRRNQAYREASDAIRQACFDIING